MTGKVIRSKLGPESWVGPEWSYGLKCIRYALF